MIRRIVDSSIRARRFVFCVGLAAMVLGLLQLRTLDFEAFPEFGPPTVRVQTDALGLSAEEVEQLVTVPMENDLLDGVAWLDRIHSKSVPGLSFIEMTFKPDTSIYRARQAVQERISQAAGLPNVSRPPQMLQPISSTGRTAMIALSSKTLTPIQIGVLARWTIRPRLLAISGVSNVAIWGQRERQLQVLVNPAKLQEKKVTLEDVVSSTGNALWVSPLTFLEASTPGTGGFIDTPTQRLGIQHNLPILEPADLAKISIDDTDGKLTIGDVATVVEAHQPLIGDADVGGGGSFLMAVDRLPNASTKEVADSVDQVLAELRPALGDLVIDTSLFRPQTYVRDSEKNTARAVLACTVGLVLALSLLLRGWRSTAVVSFATVLSFVGAAAILDLAGRQFNQFVVVGLALAIVVVVNDALVQSAGPDQGSPAEGAAKAAKIALWTLVAFGISVTPIFLMKGVSSKAFLPPAALSALLSVLVSLVVSITVTPACNALSGASATGNAAGYRFLQSFSAKYLAILRPFTRMALPGLATLVVMFAVSATTIPQFRKALLPSIHDPNLVVKWRAPSGTSLTEMDRIVGLANADLRKLPAVNSVGAEIGQAVLGDLPVGSDVAETWVSLNSSANHAAAVKAVRNVVEAYPGVKATVASYLQHRTRSSLGRTSDEVTVRVSGQDFAVLNKLAGDIAKKLGALKGVKDTRVNDQGSEPTIQVKVDLLKAQKFGIKPGDVRRASATLLSGLRVGNLFQDQKIFDVVVYAIPSSRASATGIKDLLINTPSGRVIRLADVADVTMRPTPPVIEHEDISRFVDVKADVTGDAGAVRRKVAAQLSEVQFPFEYHAAMLTDFQQQQNAQRRILGFAIAAIILVFLVFQASTGSWRLAAIGIGSVLAPLSGGLLGARIHDRQMTIAEVLGLIAIVLFALRSTFQYFEHYLDLRRNGGTNGEASATEAASDFFAPLLATTLFTAVVAAPLVVMGPRAGLEVIQPMSIVFLSGLVTLLITSLLVLPGLASRFGPKKLTRSVHFELHEHGHRTRPLTVSPIASELGV